MAHSRAPIVRALRAARGISEESSAEWQAIWELGSLAWPASQPRILEPGLGRSALADGREGHPGDTRRPRPGLRYRGHRPERLYPAREGWSAPNTPITALNTQYRRGASECGPRPRSARLS